MSDIVVSILMFGVEIWLIPVIFRLLRKHIEKRWVVYVLLILIVLLMTTLVGTAVSVSAYFLSRG